MDHGGGILVLADVVFDIIQGRFKAHAYGPTLKVTNE